MCKKLVFLVKNKNRLIVENIVVFKIKKRTNGTAKFANLLNTQAYQISYLACLYKQKINKLDDLVPFVLSINL